MVIKLNPREYQQAIFATAREKNTLVVLPTGVGKTLIALMLAVDRIEKFPGKKIVILAPTRPLVEQHLKSFESQLGELYAEMHLFTGSVVAKERKKLFQTAEIIFSTPQCIANDLKSGLYTMHDVTLLVIDEAHRCLKNYDYTKVVDYYKRQSEQQLILGLTASPGAEESKVKEICKHLAIDEIEVRNRESEDVKPYLQELEFDKVEVPFPAEFLEIKVLLKKIYDSQVEELRRRNLLFGAANKVTLLKLQGKLGARYTNAKDFNAMKGMSLTASAIKISHAIELLETQTLSGVYEYMQGLLEQAKQKKSKAVQNLVKSAEFGKTLVLVQQLRAKEVEHPKVEECAVLVERQFEENPKSKIIIFTQFRETGVVLAKRLNGIKEDSGSSKLSSPIPLSPTRIEGSKVKQNKASSSGDEGSINELESEIDKQRSEIDYERGDVSSEKVIRVQTFFGQAKKGNTGLSQKEQKEVVAKLNSGEINVLVATSIGEEGLDISEVSAVIFYEPVPSAIRKIQRAGRTARLAPGKLVILITKDTRDVVYHYASRAREKKMYTTIETVREGLSKEKEGLGKWMK